MTPYAFLKFFLKISLLFIEEYAQLKTSDLMVIFFLIPIQFKVIIKLTNTLYLIGRKYPLDIFHWNCGWRLRPFTTIRGSAPWF